MVVGELIGEEKLAVGRLDAGSERSNEWAEHVLVGVEDLKLKLKWKLDWTRCLVDKGYESPNIWCQGPGGNHDPNYWADTEPRQKRRLGRIPGLDWKRDRSPATFCSDLNGSNLRFYLRSVRANDMTP